MADPVFNPPGCQVPAVEPIEPLPDVVCELPDPDLTPIRDCPDPLFPSRGSPGLRGPQGLPGEQGPVGLPGDPGDTGEQGQRGLDGPQGRQGPRGGRGPRGYKGKRGPVGLQGPDGPRGPNADVSPRGPQGEKGATGEKGTIILPYTDENNVTRYIGLVCVEMPEARFEDVARVRLTGNYQRFAIDPRFIEVCEPGSITLCGLSAEQPIALAGEVSHNSFELTTGAELPEGGLQVAVTLSGLRKGFTDRFPKHTREQMERNNAFWQANRRPCLENSSSNSPWRPETC